MHRSLLRTATLTLALGLSLNALAQQSPLPPGVSTTTGTTTFTPTMPVYQSNMTRGQATAPAVAPGMPPSEAATAQAQLDAAGMPVAPGLLDTGPKTAVEQGYDGDALEREAAARRAAEEAANDNPRQRGERITIPSYRDTVARNPADTEWLINWKRELVAIGVHPDKVAFEAGRLPHDQFELWASRMVWALRGNDYRPAYARPAPFAAPAVAPARVAPCCQAQAADCCR